MAGFIVLSAFVTQGQETGIADDSLHNQQAGNTREFQNSQEIDQRLRVLERLREVDQEQAAKRAEESPLVGAGKDGFFLRAPDTSFLIKLRLEAHFDGRYFLNDDSNVHSSTFLVRRLRPIIEGKLPGPFSFKITPDFGNGKIDLLDAYVESDPALLIGLRLGKFKQPFGLEQLQSTPSFPFVEQSLSTSLGTNRDVGAQIQGDFRKGFIAYAIGVFNGATDGAVLDADSNSHKDIAGRIFFQPFSSISLLQGLGIGFAATSGWHGGLPRVTGLPSYKTAGQETYFKYKDTTIAAGERTRLSYQGYYYLGPVGILGEYIESKAAIARKTAQKDLTNKGWQTSISYAATGEPNSYRGIKPFRAFDPSKRQWGAIEVIGRVSAVTFDKNSFPVFADSTKSVNSTFDYGVGINWHLNRNAKFLVDYFQTSFDGGKKGGDRDKEQVIAGRLQIVY